ncbi:MAG TPA: ABC transporter substrate-binding protein [Rhodopila sp.]|uniref:MlaC/ttg2D family ABC transporter substrate-binding protein n=1 Tax=Rhodopila sp. TaxID=2480087 RepID=UPI002CA7AFA6|nr:ABC transporter substrate-binding protein [Rhodopila sp.]HVY17501.1 ABC transporter substrate-binding protein [Rhodopila sp.]
MILRRDFLTIAAATALMSFAPAWAPRARAQDTGKATSFVKQTGDRLVAVVNGAGSSQDKRAQMTQILNDAVDVDGIARFCLGRFWRTATPAQQQEYVRLFHQVLVTNITSKLGEYKGVSFVMGRARTDGENDVVSTTVNRPNNPPTAVDWVVTDVSSNPKIVDVLAEGTSLRLTQRQDYASYLVHNNNSVDALISAMKNQVASNG